MDQGEDGKRVGRPSIGYASNADRVKVPLAADMRVIGRDIAEMLDQIDNLVRLSHEAKTLAYCRYSKFRVGAALLCQDGTIIKGCNVENASYGLTICAERTALVKAVSEGHRQFKAIAISSDLSNEFITPCGACRQFLVEKVDGQECKLTSGGDKGDNNELPFGLDWDVFMTKPDMTYTQIKTGELLPLCFTPASLEEERVSHSA